jgi:hypothetical protein
VGTLLRALLEGFGWHVGKEAAREALDCADRALAEPTPPDPKIRVRAEKARVASEARAAKERTAARRREERAVEKELAEMKKRVKATR